MTDHYEKIRKALADMDAAAEARNALAWRDAHARFVVHVAPDTIRALLAERDQLAAALEAAREDAERYRWLRKGANRGANDDVAVVMGLGAMDYGMSAVAYTYSEELDGDDLDAAIDDAMQRTSGGDHG